MQGARAPASVDNLPTSGGQEDHVSMGMTAALLRNIVENGESSPPSIAGRDVRYREPFEPGIQLRRCARCRAIAPPLGEDRSLAYDIEAVARDSRRQVRRGGTWSYISVGVLQWRDHAIRAPRGTAIRCKAGIRKPCA
jgi:hypothetical protein